MALALAACCGHPDTRALQARGIAASPADRARRPGTTLAPEEKLSHALMHKMPSLLEYKSITALDISEVDTILVEDPDPPTARSAPRKSGRDRCCR
jgi:hypothetical protein